MSIVNFAAQIAIPSYEKLHPIRSEILDEALARSGRRQVAGVLGELIPELAAEVPPEYFDARITDGPDNRPEPGHGFEPPHRIPPRVMLQPVLKEDKTCALQDLATNHDTVGRDIVANRPTIVIPQMPRVKTRHSHQIPRLERRTTRKPLHLTGQPKIWQPIIATFVTLISVAVVGSFSHGFQWGTLTTRYQLVAMINWMVCSIGLHVQDLKREFIKAGVSPILSGVPRCDNRISRRVDAMQVLGHAPKWWFQHSAAVSVLGMLFVMVGMELEEYGDCTYFG